MYTVKNLNTIPFISKAYKKKFWNDILIELIQTNCKPLKNRSYPKCTINHLKQLRIDQIIVKSVKCESKG